MGDPATTGDDVIWSAMLVDCCGPRRPVVKSRYDVIAASFESLSSSLQLDDVTDDFPTTNRSMSYTYTTTTAFCLIYTAKRYR